jgi:hypothetical protein
MKRNVRVLVLFLLVVGIAGALIWGFYGKRGERAEEAEGEAPVKSPTRVSSEKGQTILSFDDEAQTTNGIRTAALSVTRHRKQAQATGVVVQLQPLLDLKASYNAPRTDLLRTRANARASAEEYRRLKELNEDGKNASDKSVEAARAASENDAALVENAQQVITTLNGTALLHWGPIVAGWIGRNSPELDALLGQRRFLLQVTSTAPAGFVSSSEAVVQFADGMRGRANFISIIPQLDPRLQTPSVLYLVPAHPGVVPGLSLEVFLPTGPIESGVEIPSDAVVWSQGSAWCYVEILPGKFVRTAVDTSDPATHGWFTNGVEPGARVVTAGAQTLLSEEFRSQIQADTD